MRDLWAARSGVGDDLGAGAERVPAGFTITTEACVAYLRAGGAMPPGLETQVASALGRLEERAGKRLGDPADPLLVSVRSGARESMPGMLDTVLNLGLGDEAVEGLAAATGDERFAWDSYRRFAQMFGNVCHGITGQRYEELIAAAKRETGVNEDTELSVAQLRELTNQFKALFEAETGSEFPQDPGVQLAAAIATVFDSWRGKRAVHYRRLNGIPEEWGTAVNVQELWAMELGGFEPPTSWVRSTNAAFPGRCRIRLNSRGFANCPGQSPGLGYAVICGDMRGVTHFWREVGEMKKPGWTCRRMPDLLGAISKVRAPALDQEMRQLLAAQRERVDLGLGHRREVSRIGGNLLSPDEIGRNPGQSRVLLAEVWHRETGEAAICGETVQPAAVSVLHLAMGGLKGAAQASEAVDGEGVVEQPAAGIAGHDVIDVEHVVGVVFRAAGLQATRTEVVEETAIAEDDPLSPALAIATRKGELAVDAGEEQRVGSRGGNSRGDRNRIHEATEVASPDAAFAAAEPHSRPGAQIAGVQDDVDLGAARRLQRRLAEELLGERRLERIGRSCPAANWRA